LIKNQYTVSPGSVGLKAGINWWTIADDEDGCCCCCDGWEIAVGNV
jgi:hypothetical protein